MSCKKYKKSRRIVLLARDLDYGGAQRQLIALAQGLRASGSDVHVVIFYSGGAFDGELGVYGIHVHILKKSGRWDAINFLIRLANCLRELQPNVVYSFLDIPNIVAVALKPIIRDAMIVWGVRASNMDLSRYNWLSRMAYALECRLANFADCIIANSHAGKLHAISNGFPDDKMLVVPNGIDIGYFQSEPARRQLVRAEWHVAENDVLVGLVGRLDPMKDHQTFLCAASHIARAVPNVRFVCVGSGPGEYASMLKQRSADLGLREQLLWVEARDDMPAIYSALDVAVSSSAFGEGFSNTIAEAMACGVPCVVTDVGDSALIVGDVGKVVVARDPDALATAIKHMVDLSVAERRTLGEASRARVISEFGIDKLVQRTEQALGLV